MLEKKKISNWRAVLINLLIVYFTILFVPQVCSANAGIGFLSSALPHLLVAMSFFCVVAIEAQSIAKKLSGSSRKALFISLWINFITTLVGYIISWIVYIKDLTKYLDAPLLVFESLFGNLLESLYEIAFIVAVLVKFFIFYFYYFGIAFIISVLLESFILYFYYSQDGWPKIFRTSIKMNFKSYLFLTFFFLSDIVFLSILIIAPLFIYLCHNVLRLLFPNSKLSSGSKSLFFIGSLLITVVVFIVVPHYLPNKEANKARDSRIISAISQAKTVMTYIAANDTNYDNLQCDNTTCTCSNTELGVLCKEIDENNKNLGFGFVRNKASGSNAGCIWADLNAGGDQNYYCADSAGRAGYTTTSPDRHGYCVNNISAICPDVY